MKFKIEKNVPMPESRRAGKSSAGSVSYPFVKMAVGDSFKIGDLSPARVRSAASYHVTMSFTVRPMGDESYRCWRTK